MQNLTPYSDLHDLVAALTWDEYHEALLAAARRVEPLNNPDYYLNVTPAHIRHNAAVRLRDMDLAIKGGWPPEGWIVEAVALHLGLMRCSDSPAMDAAEE